MFLIRHNREAASHVGYDLRTSGSWRAIQKYDTQGLKRVGDKPSMIEALSGSLSGVWIFSIIITVIFTILILGLY